jgi:hypothetical protein
MHILNQSLLFRKITDNPAIIQIKLQQTA